MSDDNQSLEDELEEANELLEDALNVLVLVLADARMDIDRMSIVQSIVERILSYQGKGEGDAH